MSTALIVSERASLSAWLWSVARGLPGLALALFFFVIAPFGFVISMAVNLGWLPTQ